MDKSHRGAYCAKLSWIDWRMRILALRRCRNNERLRPENCSTHQSPQFQEIFIKKQIFYLKLPGLAHSEFERVKAWLRRSEPSQSISNNQINWSKNKAALNSLKGFKVLVLYHQVTFQQLRQRHQLVHHDHHQLAHHDHHQLAHHDHPSKTIHHPSLLENRVL